MSPWFITIWNSTSRLLPISFYSIFKITENIPFIFPCTLWLVIALQRYSYECVVFMAFPYYYGLRGMIFSVARYVWVAFFFVHCQQIMRHDVHYAAICSISFQLIHFNFIFIQLNSFYISVHNPKHKAISALLQRKTYLIISIV